MAMHSKKNNGKKNGKPMSGGKKMSNGNGNGLTAAQKKLPMGLQQAILKSKKKKKAKK